MSILRPIVRACAVGALRDRTWAESRVFDSDMTPLADAVLGRAASPYIVVYTDTDDFMPTGAEVYDGEARSLSLVLEIGVASAIENDEGAKILQFAATDEGMELAVDVTTWQATAALWGDPYSQYGDLLKRIAYRLRRVQQRRGGQAQGGIRFAARRVTYVVSTIDDIPPGVVPPDHGPIQDFIGLASSEVDLHISGLANNLKLLLSTSNAPTWRQAQSYMGMSTEAIKKLGPDGTPVPYPEIEDPPLDYTDPNEFVPVLTDIKLSPGEPPVLPYEPNRPFIPGMSATNFKLSKKHKDDAER